MWELRTIGRVAVLSPSGSSAGGAAAQRKPLAVLALLAAAGDQGLTRERLTGFLWPELSEDRARQALRQVMYALRRDLAAPGLFLDAAAIHLHPECLTSDLAALAAARRAGDWARVVELRQGVFLDGFYLSGAEQFERWVEEERARIEQTYRDALEHLALAAVVAEEHRAAAGWWRRLLAADPLDGRVALALMQALVARGSPGLALEAAREHEATVREELGTGVDPRITRMVQVLRDEMAAQGHTVQMSRHTPSAEPAAVQPTPARPAPVRRRIWVAGSVAVGAVIVAALMSPRANRVPAEIRPASDVGLRTSVAVVPLEDASVRPFDHYLGLALSKELARNLGQVAALRVLGPEFTAAVRDSVHDPSEVGRALGVGTVLEGATRLDGEWVTLLVRLVDASSGRVLWSREGEHQLADLPAELGRTTRAIAGILEAKLSLREQERLGRQLTRSVQAYRDYLRSTALSPVNRLENETGIEMLHQVITLDPGFALAHASLAHRYVFQGFLVSPVYRDSGYASATRALELDPELVPAHVELGALEVLAGRPATGCFSFLRALELSPNEVAALANLSDALSTVGRFDESLYWAARALQIAPNVAHLHAHLGVPLYYLAADRAAAAHLRAAEQRWPDVSRIQVQWAKWEVVLGQDSAALARSRRAAETHPGDREVAVALAQMAVLTAAADAESLVTVQYRLAPNARPYGHTSESLRALLALIRLRRGDSVTAWALADSALHAALTDHARGGEDPNPAMEVAALYALRGRSDMALEWLRKASALGWKDYRLLRRDPFFTSLRGDPGFRAIIGNMESAITVMRQRALVSQPAVLSSD